MRGLVLAALVACDTTTGSNATLDVEDTDVADVADIADSAPVLRDTSEVEASTSCAAPELPAEIVLGRDDAAWCFEVLAPEATVEIVHGLQGGIHVELRLAIASASSVAPSTSFEVELQREGTTLGRFASGLVSLQPLAERTIPTPGEGTPDGSDWATPAFPVVFASADASLYAGLAADLHARAVVGGRTVDLDPLRVYLSDPLLAPSPH